MTKAGLQAIIKLEEPRSLPHGRTLELEYDDGGRVELLLDQGLGFWRVRGRAPFDFNANVVRQVEAVMRANGRRWGSPIPYDGDC